MKEKPKHPKIIVILGQTATGKSDFAVEIAKTVGGEIISADSRQVYKGMDLGTGKITKKEMRGIPHHLLDIASPSRHVSMQGGIFSVNDFQKLAFKKIKEIENKGKIPIICGGTGFYIDAVVNNTNFPEVPPNIKLREQLSKKSAKQLLKMLEKLDNERAKNIDRNNSIRLIRAIEIAKALGKVPSSKPCLVENKFEIFKIGLILPPEILKERITTRLLARIKKGMIKEVESLHKNGVSWKRMNQLGLEYRYVSLYLQKKLVKYEMIAKLNTEIWHFAKRQKTWFKRDPDTLWIDPRKNSDKNKAMREVKKFLK
jgi:tRNA dimethylallyltransferase